MSSLPAPALPSAPSTEASLLAVALPPSTAVVAASPTRRLLPSPPSLKSLPAPAQTEASELHVTPALLLALSIPPHPSASTAPVALASPTRMSSHHNLLSRGTARR